MLALVLLPVAVWQTELPYTVNLTAQSGRPNPEMAASYWSYNCNGDYWADGASAEPFSVGQTAAVWPSGHHSFPIKSQIHTTLLRFSCSHSCKVCFAAPTESSFCPHKKQWWLPWVTRVCKLFGLKLISRRWNLRWSLLRKGQNVLLSIT